MTDQTVTSTSIKQLPKYAQEYDEALLAQIFGSPDKNGVLQGGLMDAEAYPDLFKVPDYVQAGEDPLQTAVYNTFDTDKERQAFMDRANPYFMDKSGNARYLPDAADQFSTGADTIASALTDYFPDAQNYIDSGTGGVNAKGIYDRELKGAMTRADKGTQGFNASGRGASLYKDATNLINAGDDLYKVNPNAYNNARKGIKAGQGTYDLSGGLGDARDALMEAGEGEFNARGAYKRGTDRAFELAEQGLGKFDPASATQAFMDPYKSQVVDAAMDRITREGAQQRQADSAKAIGAGAFGGSRAGVQAAETQRAIEETKQSTIANLMSQGYDKSLANAMSTDEAARGRALKASGLTGELGARGTTIEQKAYEDAANRGLAAADTSAVLAQTEEQLRQKAYEDGKSRGLTGAKLEASVAEAVEGAKQSSFEDREKRQLMAGSALGDIASDRFSTEATSFEGAEGRMLKAADMYRTMGLSSAEAETRAEEDEYKRNMEAGRLTGGLGSTVGQLGGAQADIGKGYGALAGTSADIGSTYAGMAPADLNFMYGLGGKSREYDQQYNDYERQNALNYTQETLAPYSYAQNFLTGAPSASMYGQFTSQPSQAPNPFLQGVGMYATYQGAQ